MVITINNTTSTWKETLEFLVSNLELAEKGHNGFFFRDILVEKFDLTEDPFEACCYCNKKGKLSSLRKQYLNQESLSQIFSADRVEVSMVGGPKWGSAAGNKHCMKSLTVDHQAKTVRINFRNSDFFKKFLVDIYFVQSILGEVGIKNYTYSCHFENLTLRIPFAYLFLNQVYKASGEHAVKKYLESDNQLMVAFLGLYRKQINNPPSYKSLERSQRRMIELTVYNKVIKEYIE